jgi:SAM-dependent MidA family methyltransferase
MSANVYEAPGEQDITADVNFTALTQLAQEHGMAAMPLATQSQFLLGIGEQTEFSDVFEGCVLPQEHAKRALQLKHLITPGGMGEAFHVLVLAKAVEKENAARLSGLNFARTSVIR